jgi:anti-anti-sigma factor
VNETRCAGLPEDEHTFTVAVGRRKAVTTVHVTGEIDSFTGGDLEAVLHEQVADRPIRLIVDLSRVAVLGSTGLAILSRAKDVCHERGVELSLAGSGRQDLARQLTITGLDRLLVAVRPGVPQPGRGVDARGEDRPGESRPDGAVASRGPMRAPARAANVGGAETDPIRQEHS